MHLHFAEITQVLHSSRFKLLFPLFWTTSFTKYKRQTHFQDIFFWLKKPKKKTRWSFSPKCAIGIWPSIKTYPNCLRMEQLWGQGVGPKLPKPRGVQERFPQAREQLCGKQVGSILKSAAFSLATHKLKPLSVPLEFLLPPYEPEIATQLHLLFKPSPTISLQEQKRASRVATNPVWHWKRLLVNTIKCCHERSANSAHDPSTGEISTWMKKRTRNITGGGKERKRKILLREEKRAAHLAACIPSTTEGTGEKEPLQLRYKAWVKTL